MCKQTVYMSRRFLRAFALSGSWAVFGAGIYLLAGGPSIPGIVMALFGAGLGVLAFSDKSLKVGAYPRVRVLLTGFTAASLLLVALSLRVFAKGTSIIAWAIYFVGVVALLGYSALEFARSYRSDPGQDSRTSSRT
jgi:hypothetical protein